MLVQDLSVQQFVERFERPRLPVVISGLCDSWKGHEKWTEENLVKYYGEHKFKVCHARPNRSATVVLQLHLYCKALIIRPNQIQRTSPASLYQCDFKSAAVQIGAADEGYALCRKLKHYMEHSKHS